MKFSTPATAHDSEAREHCFVIMSYKPAYHRHDEVLADAKHAILCTS